MTCQQELQEYLKNGRNYHGHLILTLAQEVRENNRLAFDLGSEWSGATRLLFQAQADVAYQKIADEVKKYLKNNSGNERSILQFARDIEPHTKNAEFRYLLQIRGNKDVHVLHRKILEYEENERLRTHFGIAKNQILTIADTFNIEPKQLTATYANPEQDKVQVEGVHLLNNLISHRQVDEPTIIIADCVNIAMNLNAQAQTNRASTLMQNLHYATQGLLGAGEELWNKTIDQSRAALIWMPIITSVSTGLSLAGITAGPAIAAFALGTTLYYLSQYPDELKTQIKNLGVAITQGTPYEAGQLAARLGLEAVSAALACKNLDMLLTKCFKNGIADATIKNIKKASKLRKNWRGKYQPIIQ